MAVAKPPLQTAAILLLLLVAAASWLQTADAASGTYGVPRYLNLVAGGVVAVRLDPERDWWW
jgi:hypothetical protein